MRLTQTHTFVTMELSKAAYDEIAQKMRDAAYKVAATEAWGEFARAH